MYKFYVVELNQLCDAIVFIFFLFFFHIIDFQFSFCLLCALIVKKEKKEKFIN